MKNIHNNKIGIIGGKGKMGSWFNKLFKAEGFETIVSDISTELTPIDVAKMADVVIVSVPMGVFPSVIKEIGPYLNEDKFLTDLCSLKERELLCMMQHTRCSVCGTHPLFGPLEDAIKGRRLALCPGRGDNWFDWWERLLTSLGAKTFTVTAKEHDTVMAWVQALNHFILLSLGMSLEKNLNDSVLKKDILFGLATPSFERQMKIVERLMFQDPELYATIQFSNPHTMEAIEGFMKNAKELFSILQNRDKGSFIDIFKRVQEFGKKERGLL